MGKGLGAGEGTGKGVKGGWRVNAFLLLLTGWQAVLLPWSPLILRDAGFSATSVGVLSGGTTMAATLGVIVCLRAMRRSRSGAVRRLLLWLLLATAILLQGSGVGFELRHLSQGGVMSSCVNGWLFAPASSLSILNNTSTTTTPHFPKTASTEKAHGLSSGTIIATSVNGSHEAGSVVNLHLQHTTPHRPASVNHTVTTTITPAPTTSPAEAATPPPPPTTTTAPTTTITTTPTPTTTTTTTPATTAAAVAAAATSTFSVATSLLHHRVPAVKTSIKKSNHKVHLKNQSSLVKTLTFGNGNATEAPHRKLPATRKPVIPANSDGSRKHHNSHFFPPDVSSTNSEHSKNFRKTKYQKNHKHIQLPSDDDYNLEDNDSTSFQKKYEYDDPGESKEDEEELDYKDDFRKLQKHHPMLSSFSSSYFDKLHHSPGNTRSKPSKLTNLLQHNVLKSYLQKIPNKIRDSFHKPHNTDSFTTERKLNDQESLPFSYNPRYLPLNRPSNTIRDPYDGKSQYQDDGLYDIDSRHAFYRRSRRDLTKTENPVPPAIIAAKEKPELNDAPEKKQNSSEEIKSDSVKVIVAVLLVLGGLAGAGIEAGIAQLWHCIVHGYDESGVSQDVLQRTISHTFHLSTYGSHKTWTGITSGGWTMGAGVVSILACFAGIGGGGYGGLLVVHLSLGVAALLFLLVLPVPYGSIDPPRTRRPLSLYLDDEVLREGVRRLTFHIWVFINGCLVALSLTFSLWLLQDMTAEGWLVGSQAGAVGMTLLCESLALHTQRRLVIRWGLHGLMGVCGVSLMLHYGFMWASKSAAVVVIAHAGLGVAMAFLWVAVKHNALLLATVSDQEREAWASWWCWRLGLSIGAAMWGVGVSGSDDRVQPMVLLATVAAAIFASSLCMTAVLSSRNSRTRRRVYHTLDLDIANDEVDEEEVDEEEDDATEDDWLVKRAKKEGLTL